MIKLVKSYYDFQLMRIRLANRLGLKKDESEQKQNPKNDYSTVVETDPENKAILEEMYNSTTEQEKQWKKLLFEVVRKNPLWDCFLKNVKGCGELMSAVIISEVDFHKCDTVSKLWAYAGLSPGMTRGKKWNTAKTKIITTDTMVRQDKKTKGFLCPFNSFFRSKLIGVLASSFLKSKSEYTTYYYNMRQRLESKGWGEDSKKPSKKENPKAGHQNNHAKRYMIKMFLLDLYIAGRKLHGLPVREPYQEEYLGKKHSA